jgi:class 3 adenylate cyclase
VICTRCQRENPEDATFCAGCGSPLALVCPSCNRSNPTDASFCNGCGQRLRGDAPAAPPDRTPRDYTPKHLADKILQSKSALEGERKQVTVLFADVKGSMELAEQVDPEEWHRILDRFFQILADGVHRFEGTASQYTGDGIMALFGAPSPTRITPSAPATRRFTCARSCGATPTSCGAATARASPFAWG